MHELYGIKSLHNDNLPNDQLNNNTIRLNTYYQVSQTILKPS